MSTLSEELAATLLREVDESVAYAALVNGFAQLTAIRNPASGTCCTRQDKHGAPMCCYTVTNGACTLSFTTRELTVLRRAGVDLSDTGVTFQMSDADATWQARC